MEPLYLMYTANIIVAGWIGFTSLLNPHNAQKSVFSGTIAYSEIIRLVGALWSAIAILSILGYFYPIQMSVIFLFQWIYKTSWLMIVALPAYRMSRPYPRAMALFFLIWSLSLPLVIPWRDLF